MDHGTVISSEEITFVVLAIFLFVCLSEISPCFSLCSMGTLLPFVGIMSPLHFAVTHLRR